VSLAVRQRTREIGIRIAIGAQPAGVARTFLASGMRGAAAALALGMPVRLAALSLSISQGVVILSDVDLWPGRLLRGRRAPARGVGRDVAAGAPRGE
jgi:hypothetical protein